MNRLQRYISEQVAAYGVAVLSPIIAAKVRPDLWDTAAAAEPDFAELCARHVSEVPGARICEFRVLGDGERMPLAVRLDASLEQFVLRVLHLMSGPGAPVVPAGANSTLTH